MLRTRLFLHLAPFVLILLALGMYAMFILASLGSGELAIVQPESARQSMRLMVVGLVLALGGASFICYKVERAIVEPIQALTQATRKLAQGNLDATVSLNLAGEVNELAIAFNKMAAQLRNYRHSAAGKLLRLHRMMEATLEAFPDPVFVLNPSGSVEFMNSAATELFEKGGAFPELLDQAVQRSLREGESLIPADSGETIRIRSAGQTKHFLPRVVIMRHEKNALLGFAVVLHDLSRFQLMHELKSDWLATVCHELNTPLTGVRMAVHLLLEPQAGPLTSRQRELAVTARDDVERLLRRLSDLLNATKLRETSVI